MKVTKDGDYSLGELFPDSLTNNSSIIYISGAGTIRLGYLNDADDFIPLTNGEIENPSENKVEHGFGNSIVMAITGVSAAAPMLIEVKVN